jgi:hypothetical protein
LIFLAARLEKTFELDVHVEVVLNRVFAAAGDDDDDVDARSDRFFDAVLDDRLVDERQHLLGLGFRGGKEPRAEAGGRKNGFANGRFHARHSNRISYCRISVCLIRFSSATTRMKSAVGCRSAG